MLAVAVTVCELPAANVPPPLTVPPALGDALTATVYCVCAAVAAVTVRDAGRAVLGLFFEPLTEPKLILPTYVPLPKFFALDLIEKVIVVPKLVAIPDVDEAVSQFGRLLIEYLTAPLFVVSLYLNVDGEMDRP
jgi:hypothetical protein